MKLTLALTAIASLCFALASCTGDACEQDQCSGDQIMHCVDGVLGAAEDCDDGMMCMTMGSGVEHCMAMGDDDDSGMDM